MLSEEGKAIPFAERKTWTDLWIVDPLDGTKEFIKRNGEFTVNIAWVQKGVPRMGVIYVPVKRVLYIGIEGIGGYRLADVTSRNGASLEELTARAVRLPVEAEHDRFVIVASRSHSTPETENILKRPELLIGLLS